MSNASSLRIAGKMTAEDLSFTHWFDRSSPAFMLYCASGKHIPEAKLVVRKVGENPLDYIMITMSDVLVTSVSPTSIDGEGGIAENVTLKFEKVKVDYRIQDSKGGSKPGLEFLWNFATNSPD